MRSAAGMPSHRVIACSMPGSFLMKRPPEAISRASLRYSPESVWTRRPPSLTPVTLART